MTNNKTTIRSRLFRFLLCSLFAACICAPMASAAQYGLQTRPHFYGAAVLSTYERTEDLQDDGVYLSPEEEAELHQEEACDDSDDVFVLLSGDLPTISEISGVIMPDWWKDASFMFPRNATATVTDVRTGLSYQIKRMGGTNHADTEPLTREDTNIMKEIYGGAWSWDRRAIIVEINGQYLAASQNGMPHGQQTIYDNDYQGQFCIHFLNSRTHGGNKVCSLHQAAVKEAYAAFQ